QAEDGIRGFHVTGVQTCALPIFQEHMGGGAGSRGYLVALEVGGAADAGVATHPQLRGGILDVVDQKHLALAARRKVRYHGAGRRSEERRVGKERKDSTTPSQ